MTDFVTRDDTNLGVGRILTSPTMYALYDNVFSLASGGLGAPRIQTAAIQDLAVTHGKLAANLEPWELISSASVSTSVATVDFPSVFSGTYYKYKIVVAGAQVSTNNVVLWFRVTADNGATYGTTYYNGTTTETFIALSPVLASGYACFAEIDSMFTGTADRKIKGFIVKSISSSVSVNAAPSYYSGSGASRIAATSALTGFRLLFSSGNIAGDANPLSVGVYGMRVPV